MDDMYQYAASAVHGNSNSTNNSTVQGVSEENDVLLQAFTNFGWSQRFHSLVDTVKKQSETIVKVTKKDLQEFAQVLKEDLVDEVEETGDSPSQAAPDTPTSTSTSTREVQESPMDSLRNVPSKATQSLSIPLPGNMDLSTLKEEATQGTKVAERYLEKFGTQVMQMLNETITVLEPEVSTNPNSSAAHPGAPTAESASVKRENKIYATRREAMLASLRNTTDCFLQDPDSEKDVYYSTFIAGFHCEEYTDEIAQLLETSPDLRVMMDTLVPVQVSYALFWQRYFYQTWKMDQDEKRRQSIVKGVDEEADFKWDSEEEEDPKDNADPKERQNDLKEEKQDTYHTIKKDKGKEREDMSTSLEPPLRTASSPGPCATPTPEYDTDFSTVSEQNTEPSLLSAKSHAEDWKTEDKKTDSDSDWE